jgi:F-type H+-transporting ATPase subunit b
VSAIMRFAGVGTGILLMACFTAVPPIVRGQEKPKSTQSSAQESSDKGSRDQKSSKKAIVERPRGPAQQLAHETREAAGEEDETAEFKQSASVRLISQWTGLSLRRSYWLSILSNFIVVAAIIIWAARKYLPAIFRERTVAIQKAMQEAQKASEEARRRLADIEARLMKLDVEIGMMRDAADSEAADEEARIEAAAKEEVAKIVDSVEQEIAAAIKAARRELTAYTAELAVTLAQKQIHVNPATDQALVKNFAGQLGAASGDGNGDAGRGH